MVSSLVCNEGGSEWIAENEQGQRGQRVGVDVTVTCIQGKNYLIETYLHF